MGCGRSWHQSPSVQSDYGTQRDGKDSGRDTAKDSNNKPEEKRTAANTNKSVSREAEDTDGYTTKKTTNGRSGGIWSDRPMGGVTRSEGVARRDWQLEEAIDTPTETVMAIYRSSVPASSRASLNPASDHASLYGFSYNGALLNGRSFTSDPTMVYTNETQMEIQVKTYAKDPVSGGSVKAFHITSSQQEFFKMLDEKIEKGADYFSDDD